MQRQVKMIGTRPHDESAMPTRTRRNTVLSFTLLSIVAGAIFGHLDARVLGGGAGAGYLRGAVVGGLMCLVLISFEIALEMPRAERFRQAPFSIALTARSLVYLGVILLTLYGSALVFREPSDVGHPIRRAEVLFSIAIAFGFNLLSGINRLLGQRVLFNFVAGRYNRPRLEPRVLLFIDMTASTAIAERLGELRFLVLLNRFVADLTLAIAGEGGEIHKYVGDEVIATWRLGRAGAAQAAIRACFAARARLAARAADYRREFGLMPEFRAALHCGPVVIGELGLLKMEIALIGDTMNTTARIQQACRDTGHAVLASAALLDRVAELPAGIVKRALGALQLRGKEAALDLCALDALDGARP
jgi:adenylate cyclase